MIRVDTDVFLLGTIWELAMFERFKFMMRLQIRPPPNSAINDMRETFSMRHLQTSIERSWNGDAFRWDSRIR